MNIELFDWQHEIFLNSKARFNVLPAGRRTGKTKGASLGAMVHVARGDEVLWVDTIYSNIDRYVERYFLPVLKESNFNYSWNVQKKLLKIEKGYIDFRSADRPESIEGFGYNKIFLNEAGIILKDDYLYTNSILPMLMDHPNSQLYAFGTPKGKINKEGKKHRFYALWERVIAQDPAYSGMQLRSYDNPMLSPDDITELEKEIRLISEDAVRQEINAEFLDASDECIFDYSRMQKFSINDINRENVECVLGAIDVADEGTDALSFPIGYLIGHKFYVIDWIHTKANTDYSIPACTDMIKRERTDYCAIETNNHGALFYKQIADDVRQTTLIPIFQTTKKHSRIVQRAGFVHNYFVFRNDYQPGSDYEKAMSEFLSYTKDGKAKHDDAPDAITTLASVLLDLFEHKWF